MRKIKIFFKYNIQQSKRGFLLAMSVITLSLFALLFFGDQKYSLFDKITLPIGFGIIMGISAVAIGFVYGIAKWYSAERYFEKELVVLIDKYQFVMLPFERSLWEMTVPALQGKIQNHTVIIQKGLENDRKKDLFIFIEKGDIIPKNKKEVFIYNYKALKENGPDQLITVLTDVIQNHI